MDEETLWVLRMLSEREISAKSAERILRALELLRKTEEGESADTSVAPSVTEEQAATAETPQAEQQIIPVEEKAAEAGEETLEVEAEVEGEIAEEAAAEAEEEAAEAGEETLEVEAEIEEEITEEVVAEAEEEKEEKAAVVQETSPLVEEVEVAEPGEVEKEQISPEAIPQVTDEEQVEEERKEEEEQPGVAISEDVERPAEEPEAAQGPQELEEELTEEIGVSISEAAVAEEKLPLSQATEAEREMELQEAVPEVALTAEEEHEAITEEMTPEEPQIAEESARRETVWTEISDEKSLLGDKDVDVLMDIPDGAEVVLEKSAGDVTIRGWDQPGMKAEGVEISPTVLREEGNLKIKSERDIVLHIPPAIGKISIANGSGLISVEKYPGDLDIDSDTGDISIREVGGSIKASSGQGSIMLENCSSEILLKSDSGNITARKAAKVNVETGSGGILLADIGGDMDAKSKDGNITIERFRGQSINAESSGGDLMLTDVLNNMSLKNDNGDIAVEGFSGEIRVKAENAEVSLRNSGDAEIYIESDGCNISVEDCYADVYVDSGKGNVKVAGGSLAFGGMGKVDLKMKSGDAYLNRRTFEDVQIALEKGNVELDMEKLSSGGMGLVSVDSGDITVKVLPSFRCEVIAHAPRKKIHMELPIEVLEKDKDRLRGTLNGGGTKIELIAPDGEIRFQALTP